MSYRKGREGPPKAARSKLLTNLVFGASGIDFGGEAAKNIQDLRALSGPV